MTRGQILPLGKWADEKKLPIIKALSLIYRPFGTNMHYVFS